MYAAIWQVDSRLKRACYPFIFSRTIPLTTQHNTYHWSEYLNFHLHPAYNILDGHWLHVLHENLMDLVSAIYLQVMDHNFIHGILAEHAKLGWQLLLRYTKTFQGLYGRRKIVFKVYHLLYIADGCKNWALRITDPHSILRIFWAYSCD